MSSTYIEITTQVNGVTGSFEARAEYTRHNDPDVGLVGVALDALYYELSDNASTDIMFLMTDDQLEAIEREIQENL